jgi:hypothetical protein
MFWSWPALAVLVESLIVAGYGVYLGVETAVAPATEPLAAVVMSALCLVLAGALFVMARALAGGRRWARSPVLVWQVLQASVAVPALSPWWQLRVVLLALCLIVVVGVLQGPFEPTEQGR